LVRKISHNPGQATLTKECDAEPENKKETNCNKNSVQYEVRFTQKELGAE